MRANYAAVQKRFMSVMVVLLILLMLAPFAGSAESTEAGEEETQSILFDGFSEMNEQQKEELADRIMEMPAEAFLNALRVTLAIITEEQQQELLRWLSENNLLEKLNEIEQPTPTTFTVPESCPWPENIPTPEQGRIIKFTQGGDSIAVKMEAVMENTYTEWKELVKNGVSWEENADKGKTRIDSATKKDFGPSGRAPEDYFTESDVEMEDATYFVATDGNGAAMIAYGGEIALLIVSQK